MEIWYVLDDAAGRAKNISNKRAPTEKVSYHKRLVADLLDHRDYNPSIRPVRNSKDGVDVYVNQKLVQILEVVSLIIFDNILLVDIGDEKTVQNWYMTTLKVW